MLFDVRVEALLRIPGDTALLKFMERLK